MSSSFHTGLGLGAWVIAMSQGGWFKLEGYPSHRMSPDDCSPMGLNPLPAPIPLPPRPAAGGIQNEKW